MDWSGFIISVLSLLFGGGLTAIFLIPKKVISEELENEKKAIDQWKGLYEQSRQENKSLREERSSQSALIDRLYDDLKECRNELNEKSTKEACLEIFKCECIECTARIPPIKTLIIP